VSIKRGGKVRVWLVNKSLRVRRRIGFIVPLIGSTTLYLFFGFVVVPRLWPEIESPKTVLDGFKSIVVVFGSILGWMGLYILGRAILDWFLLIPLPLDRGDRYE